MKSKIKHKITLIVTIALLVTFSFDRSNAQAPWYGQVEYPHDSTILTTAVRTFSNSGYIIGGVRPVRHLASQHDFVIDKVDDGGNFSSSTDFSLKYQIYDDQLCSTPAAVLNCVGVSIVETRSQGSGENYALAAAYNEGVIFALLDAYGAVIRTMNWNFPTTNYNSTRPRIIESPSNPGQYYICGGATQDMYVIKIDFNANVVWANWYYKANTQPLDLIESPYNTSELIVVGRTDIQIFNPTASDAFFMKIDANTGNFISANHYNFSNWDSDDWFSKIEIARSTTGGDGYILGGRAYGPTSNPANPPYTTNIEYIQWMCKLDRNGNVIWSSLIRPGSRPAGSLSGGEIVGVFERPNPNGSFEYYGVGGQLANPYSLGSGNLVTYKLDDNGQTGTLTPNEFHYFGGSSPIFLGPFAWGALTAIETGGGTNDGIQMFGTSPNGHYFVKGYFNGYSGCNENILNIDSIAVGPQLVGNFQPTVVPLGFCGSAYLTVNTTGSSNTICYNSSLSSGSNARLSSINGIANTTWKSDKLSLFPNPADKQVTIKLNNLAEEQHVINIVNSLGEKVKTVVLPIGNSNDVTIDIQALAPGVYFAELQGKNDRSNIRFVIQ